MVPAATPPANGSPRKRTGMAATNGERNLIRALIGALATLLVAAVLAGINTGNAVGRLDENLTLFREEVRRDLSRHEAAIGELDEKLDLHRLAEPGRIIGNGPGGGGGS